MKAGFDPLSMMKSSTAPKKSQQTEEKKEPEESHDQPNTVIEDKVK